MQQAYLDVAQRTWRAVGQHVDLFAKIDNMMTRIQSGSSRSSGSDFRDFKTGVGGMIEAEFLVQALQMRSGIWEPNWERALLALRREKVISNSDANKAAKSYELLRRIETLLRRFENKNVSALPSAVEEQQRLVSWFDCKGLDDFTKQYQTARETIHALYEQYVKARIA
jgi:glutamine synthetase adenylyltransferase